MKKIKKLVIASHNAGKIAELKKMLAPLEIEVISARDLNLPDVEETGETFSQNASLKARILAEHSGLCCLADDSGLCVDAMDGRPGVYSARYAPDRDFNKGMDMILEELKDVPAEKRTAHFACVLALCIPEENCCRLYEGRVNGLIASEKIGSNGFGYDPIFIPEGENCTFGQMGDAEKSKISHRGRALQKFLEFLQNN